MEEKFCEVHGQKPSDLTFCNECGMRLQIDEEIDFSGQPYYVIDNRCSGCNTHLEGGETYCPNPECNAKLEWGLGDIDLSEFDFSELDTRITADSLVENQTFHLPYSTNIYKVTYVFPDAVVAVIKKKVADDVELTLYLQPKQLVYPVSDEDLS